MSPHVSIPISTPIPIPLASSPQTQIVPRIKNDDQLPDKAALRTLSSFIKTYRETSNQSTTSIPIPQEYTQAQPSPLAQTHALPQTPTTTTPPPKQTPTLKMAHTTTTVTTKPSLLSRLRGAKTHRRTYENTTTHSTHHRKQRTWGRRRAGVTAQPVHHHHRKPSVGDKISGALLKLRGSLTRRPGLKAAGTRRMRGTDGKGSHHTVAY
ncbi:hypothetical protein BPOR_0239g00070 [Botrytis porri]|uniref:Uncharacterized protein n=2 Tax=Botrytis porri TaxID=87229 RepID=A0A4Z1KQW6_9HELO|nr:hypothetical protein BPOR_0239g00070 [Botrytis porri]